MRDQIRFTLEDGVDRQKVGADREDDHGHGEGQELDDDIPGDGGRDIGLLLGVVILLEDSLLRTDDASCRHG